VSEPASTRRLALAVCGALALVLFAPWYETVVIATDPAGHRHALIQSMSGWQALSTASVVCALLALGTAALLLVRGRTVVDGLGAAGRRAGRARVDGMIVTGASATAALIALIGFANHPGPHLDAVHATSSTGVRWGLGLALMLCLALAGLGLRIARDAPLSPHRDAARTRTGRYRARSPGSRARSANADG
jgi:hypothetical protein